MDDSFEAEKGYRNYGGERWDKITRILVRDEKEDLGNGMNRTQSLKNIPTTSEVKKWLRVKRTKEWPGNGRNEYYYYWGLINPEYVKARKKGVKNAESFAAEDEEIYRCKFCKTEYDYFGGPLFHCDICLKNGEDYWVCDQCKGRHGLRNFQSNCETCEDFMCLDHTCIHSNNPKRADRLHVKGHEDYVHCINCGCHTADYEFHWAETYEATVVNKGKVPQGAIAKAMMNRAMITQVSIEAIIEEVENKVNLGLISEDDLMKSLKKKFGAEYDIEVHSSEEEDERTKFLKEYFATLKAKDIELAKEIEYRIKNEMSNESRPSIEPKIIEAGFDPEIITEWVEYYAVELPEYQIFERCSSCEGDGEVMIEGSYWGGDRYDPPEADFKTCDDCFGSINAIIS